MIFDRFYGRNLQQQVMYLTWIAGQATDVVKSIVGRVDAAGGLPAASLYANGSTFAVGQEPPYTYYVAVDGMWVNIGVFPLAGSPGSPGENGRSVFVSSFSPSPASIGQSYHVPLSSFNGDPAVNDLVLLSGRWLSIVTALTPPYATALIYADLQGAQGEPGEGIDTIEKMETPYTIDSITYSIEDGLKIYGHGRINGADTYEQVLTIPIRAGENIIIDASSDNKELVISSKAAAADKWTEEEISLLETVFQTIAYTSESAGQTAADELIASLRAGAKVTGITATAVSKTRYVGDSLTAADFNVYATYSDGTRQLVTSGYTVSPEVITATSFTATVTYKAFTASVPMTAEENVATSIEVVSYTPTKTLYIGDAIATSGYYTYVITFARGNSQTMTEWAPITVSPTTFTGESTETTVSYGSLSDAYTITGAKAKPAPTTLLVTYTGSTSVGTVVTADNWSYTVKDQYGQNMDVTGSLQCVPSGNALVEGNNTFGLSLFLESATLRTEAVVVGISSGGVTYAKMYIYPSDYDVSLGAMQSPHVQTTRKNEHGWNIVGSESTASAAGTHGLTGNITFEQALTATPKTLKITRISTADQPSSNNAGYDGVWNFNSDATTATGTCFHLANHSKLNLQVNAGDIKWIRDGNNYSGISKFVTNSATLYYFGKTCPHGVLLEVEC